MVYEDFQGLSIRLPGERLAHILETHPYMAGLEWTISQTLGAPEFERRSITAPRDVLLYYRKFPDVLDRDRYICVVVKVEDGGGFVLTAYLTDNVKRGASV